MFPTFVWKEHATLTLPLRSAGGLVESLKCSSWGEVIDDGLLKFVETGYECLKITFE